MKGPTPKEKGSPESPEASAVMASEATWESVQLESDQDASFGPGACAGVDDTAQMPGRREISDDETTSFKKSAPEPS